MTVKVVFVPSLNILYLTSVVLSLIGLLVAMVPFFYAQYTRYRVWQNIRYLEC